MSHSSDYWQRVFQVGKHLQVKPSTLFQWRQRGRVPAKERYRIFQTAPELGVQITLEELNQ